MTFVAELLAVAVGTYLLRISIVVAMSGRRLHPRVESTLRLIPAAVLAALVANALVFDDDAVRPFGPWYLAAAVGAVVAARTRSAGWTLVAGMGAVWALTAIW